MLTRRIQPSRPADREPAAHNRRPQSPPGTGVWRERLAPPRGEIPGLHFRPCRAPSGYSPGSYGCAHRTSGLIGSAAALKVTHLAIESSPLHLSSKVSRRKHLQSVFVMQPAQIGLATTLSSLGSWCPQVWAAGRLTPARECLAPRRNLASPGCSGPSTRPGFSSAVLRATE